MTLPRKRERPYPTTDGKPMAETDRHRDQMTDPLYSIRWHFRNDPTTYVSGNLLLFYEKGNRRKHVSPDLFVVQGTDSHPRDNYLAWEEPVPCLVVEISSRSTWEEDLGQKKAVYASLGVPEYYLFDPTGDYLEPPLRAYRLAGSEYLPVIGSPIHSPSLNLDLVIVDRKLRLAEPDGALLPVPEEAYLGWESERQRAESERQRAESERQRADAAEARLRELEARLRELGE